MPAILYRGSIWQCGGLRNCAGRVLNLRSVLYSWISIKPNAIRSEPLVRGKKKLDLRRDPPPDLALEVDISHSTLIRRAIYAALRVPEIWRYDGLAITIHILGADGAYSVVPHSKALPQVAATDLAGLLPLQGTMDENSLFREFQSWARQRFGAGKAIPSKP